MSSERAIESPKNTVKPAVIETRGRRSGDFWLAITFAGDVIAILLGLVLGFWIRFRSGWITFGVEAPHIVFEDYLGLIAVGVGFLVVTFAYQGLYDIRNLLRLRRSSATIVRSASMWLFTYLGVSLVLKFDPPISRIYVAGSFLCVLAMVLSWRWLLDRLLQMEDVARHLRQRLLFIGWNAEAERMAQAIKQDPKHPYEVVGCVSSPGGDFQTAPVPAIRQFPAGEDLGALLDRNSIDIVALADLDPQTEEIVRLANVCEKHFVQFKVIPSYFQILVSGLRLETISGVPILGVSQLPLDRPINRLLKRVVDITGSLIGLFFVFPVALICAAWNRLEAPGPLFFSQERVGRNGRRFKMYKCRSMIVGAEATDHLNQSTLRADPRVTKAGRFMRRWNLDEVPQFWNVLKGDMSLVGPRPERTFHSEKLSFEIPHYNARYNAKPGMTGWAQIHGLRGDTDLAERIRFDLYYLENWSLWLDVQIMVQTFIQRHNAY